MVEGVIASFPALEDLLDIRRVDFKRPRAEVVALVGEANQALPVLILRPDETVWTGFGRSRWQAVHCRRRTDHRSSRGA
nr:DUF3088 domain-containing protein [Mesorhizobium amorphae]